MRNQGRDAGQPCCVSLKSCFHSTLHVIRFSGHGMRYFWRGGYRPLNLDFAIIVILTVSGRNLSMTNEQSDSSMLCTQKSGRPTTTTRRNISTVSEQRKFTGYRQYSRILWGLQKRSPLKSKSSPLKSMLCPRQARREFAQARGLRQRKRF